MTTMNGSCLCGAVQFAANNVDTHVHACHCSMCRNWNGGPALSASTNEVTFSGELAPATFASSEWAERGFCSRCGSNLFYLLKEPRLYMMCTGAFDDQESFALAGEIYVDEQPPGYRFAGDHPRQTGEEFLKSMGVDPQS